MPENLGLEQSVSGFSTGKGTGSAGFSESKWKVNADCVIQSMSYAYTYLTVFVD